MGSGRGASAPSAGCDGDRDLPEEGELDTGCRHPGVFRFGQRGMAVRFPEHRIADRRLVRLIGKWLKAGVLEDGRLLAAAGRGDLIGSGEHLCALRPSPMGPAVAAATCRRRGDRHPLCRQQCAGPRASLGGRVVSGRASAALQKFGVELHPQKSRIIEFGRHAARKRKARNLGKPKTFAFLGFTHICGTSREGPSSSCGIRFREQLREKLRQVKGRYGG